jgi:hypothetical protein
MFRVVIHLDTTKTVDGQPDPAYVREYGWAPTPDGMTQTAYVTQLKAETKLLAAAALAATTEGEGTALPGEGTEL